MGLEYDFQRVRYDTQPIRVTWYFVSGIVYVYLPKYFLETRDSDRSDIGCLFADGVKDIMSEYEWKLLLESKGKFGL